MRTLLSVSLLAISILATGCASAPEGWRESLPYKAYSPCGHMPTHSKCSGNAQSPKEIERAKAYAADALEAEARAARPYRQNRDL